MIHIIKGQKIPENDNLIVVSETGDYGDSSFIDYCTTADPDVVAGAFQAQFVRYGGIVYRFNDPKELGAALLKSDPESTHTAASFVRMNNDLLMQMNDGSLEPQSLQDALSEEKAATEEKMMLPEEESTTSTENALIPDPLPDTSVSTTTSATQTSTTTPAVQVEIGTSTPAVNTGTSTAATTDVSTSTPSITPDTLTSTTTAAVSNDAATSTPSILDVLTGTSTPNTLDQTGADTSTTTGEVVAIAKRKIRRKLGL